MRFKKVPYNELNAKQKENRNFHKLAAVLVDYGFTTLMRLRDDWNRADLIAQHKDGKPELRIQLKTRLMFSTKYLGKGLWIAFPAGWRWYLYPHDRLLKKFKFQRTKSWKSGTYSFSSPPLNKKVLLEKYVL